MASDHRALERPRLVIFDFDGVMADSERIALEELADEMTARGAAIRYEQARSLFLGRSTADHMAYIRHASGAPCAPDFPDVWHERIFTRYRRELTRVAGVQDTLDRLDRLKIDYCIASGGSVERIRFALECLDWTAQFQGRAFSADNVPRGKPAPDLFLHAAQARGVPPAACIVIEDAEAGVCAAVAAKMTCIAFVGGSHLAEIREEHSQKLIQTGARIAVRDHRHLRRLIAAASSDYSPTDK